ncbi:MAG: hypothetical protein QME58_07765 [Bacteroidota bacterium]|nr:hypothetical protein [Bacteroidota bacterium]
MCYTKIILLFSSFLFTFSVSADEINLERRVGKKFQKITVKDVIVVEETQSCIRYLRFNKESQSPEPRLANKTEGGDDRCAVAIKSSDDDRRKIIANWKKRAFTAKVILTDGSTHTVNCISIKYPLSSSLKNEALPEWHKPALLLRNGDELKFPKIKKLQMDIKSAIVAVEYKDGKQQSLQYVIKRRIHNGDLPGVLTGVTDAFAYFRVTIDKIKEIEFIE